jgi:repressor LexA
MSGDHILPGDLILLRNQDTADEGDLVVVLIGGEATLKRFHRRGGNITLMPSNEDHQPIILTEEDNEIRIVGKVRAVIRITDGGRRLP